jgi:mannitol-specific phosphotransferase system IIBC component
MCIDTIPSSFKEEQKPQSASETLFLNAFFFSFFVSALLLKKKNRKSEETKKKKKKPLQQVCNVKVQAYVRASRNVFVLCCVAHIRQTSKQKNKNTSRCALTPNIRKH